MSGGVQTPDNLASPAQDRPDQHWGPQDHLHALRQLHLAANSLHASLDLGQTLDAVARGVTSAAGFDVAVVNLITATGDYEVVAVAGSDEARASLLGVTETAHAWNELLGLAERWGGLYFVHHRHTELPLTAEWVPDLPVSSDPGRWHPDDVLLAALRTSTGELMGVLSVDMPRTGRLPGPEQLEVLELFAQHAALAIAHARLHSQLQESQARLAHAATHDPLTGLANRTLLRSAVDELMRSDGVPIGLLMIDLDGFKSVNDTSGHDAGDEVLAALAARMERQIRDGDLLARIGGDEFVLLMSGATVAQALPDAAERLRAAIREPISVAAGDQHTLGASIGSATGVTPVDFPRLLASADAAMYRDKATRH